MRDEHHCVVLTWFRHQAFSAGADMKGSASPALNIGRKIGPMALADFPFAAALMCPVIARVNGFALWGRFEMVLGCDIVIAASSARFGRRGAGRAHPLDGVCAVATQDPFNRAMASDDRQQFSAAEMYEFASERGGGGRSVWMRPWSAGSVKSSPAPLSLKPSSIRSTAPASSPAEAQALRTKPLVRALQK